MKLSEAIRLGAMLKPQGSQRMFHVADGTTCALGAAMDAMGCLSLAAELDESDDAEDILALQWPILTEHRGSPAPSWNVISYNVFGTITLLNDTHRWTREQIADWVQTLEGTDNEPTALATPTNAAGLGIDQPVLALRASDSSDRTS